MADTAVEVHFPLLNQSEDIGFAHQRRASGLSCGVSGRVGGGDDADAEGGCDGVREAQTIADDGAVFEGFEAEVELVFAAGWGAAYLGCAEVSVAIKFLCQRAVGFA